MDSAIALKGGLLKRIWSKLVALARQLNCDHQWKDDDNTGMEQHCTKCPAFRSIHGI